jgi:hypothetical protein
MQSGGSSRPDSENGSAYRRLRRRNPNCLRSIHSELLFDLRKDFFSFFQTLLSPHYFVNTRKIDMQSIFQAKIGRFSLL